MPIVITNQEHIVKYHGCCPVCRSKDISTGELEKEDDFVRQNCQCNVPECTTTWTDYYNISSISEVEDKDGNEVLVQCT